MGQNTAFSATQDADEPNYMALAGYNAQQSMDILVGFIFCVLHFVLCTYRISLKCCRIGFFMTDIQMEVLNRLRDIYDEPDFVNGIMNRNKDGQMEELLRFLRKAEEFGDKLTSSDVIGASLLIKKAKR